MGILRVLSKRGDDTVCTWDVKDKTSVIKAREEAYILRRQGYRLVELDDGLDTMLEPDMVTQYNDILAIPHMVAG